MIHGGFAIPIGLGATAIGIAKRHVAISRANVQKGHAEAAIAQDAAKVRLLIAQARSHQTVPWIAGQSQLSEAATIRALAWLRDRKALVEELDVETGEWFYCASSPNQELGTGSDLDARLEALRKSTQ